MKIRLELKSCPWCRSSPDVACPIGDNVNTNGTWLWYIYCQNSNCKIQPKTKHVPIRKEKKTNLIALIDKLSILADYWNSGLYTNAEHWVEIDLQKIIDKYNVKL